MSADQPQESRARGGLPDRALTLSGVLLLGGFVVNAIQRTLLHPAGAADDHKAIFREYASSDAWVATHIAEFLLVLVAFAGFLVLCRALWTETPYLALLAAGAITATAGIWAALQGVDGVTLKQAVDAWVAVPESERASRFSDAESVRWIEWGLQSYFRIVLGVALLLLGAAAAASRLVPTWLGVLLVVGGLLSLIAGFSVGYVGFQSAFQDAVVVGFQLVILVFALGLLVVGRQARGPGTAAPST